MSVGTETGTPAIEPLRILILDDDPDVRRLLARSLERRGHRVTVVEEASAIGEIRDYDVLCLDLDLDGRDCLEGLDLVVDARALRPELRILVETSNADPRVHDACHACGAVGVYLKGKPLAELHQLVEGA